MTWRELSAEQLYALKEPLIIDVRSPGEHAAEFIPHSLNLALLDDAERAHVGTVYKHEGEMVARRLALKVIAPKIPEIVDHILALRATGQAVVVHCWRGGLRSEAVASFLALVGIDCWRLTGGFKAWRQYLLAQFAQDQFAFETIILQGQTGAGKTEVLAALARCGIAVLDLEALANHRGSVFGGVGLGAQPTQKNFEAQLWMKIRAVGSAPLFLEAEGRRVGKLSVPDFLVGRMSDCRRILLTSPIEDRIERIFNEYSGKYGDRPEVLEQAFAQLANLRERIGAKRVQELKEMVSSGDGREAIKILLLEYYDPMYDKQIRASEPYDLTVLNQDPFAAAQRIVKWLDHETLPVEKLKCNHQLPE